MFVLMYIDDVIFTSSSDSELQQFVVHQDKAFALKDLGSLLFFCWFRCYYLFFWLASQPNQVYNHELLKKASLELSKATNSSMVYVSMLSKSDGIPLNGPSKYMLHYLRVLLKHALCCFNHKFWILLVILIQIRLLSLMIEGASLMIALSLVGTWCPDSLVNNVWFLDP